MQARADSLFTGIYIAGVTLAIATTLAMSMIYYIKIASIYPETNRSDTYYISLISCKQGDFNRQSNLAYSFIKDVLGDLDGVREVGAIEDDNNYHGVLLPDGKTEIKVQVKPVDDGFFRIYDFNFLQGEPFVAEDIDSDVKQVIISDQAAELIYGKKPDNIVGSILTLDQTDYRIKGVVEGASPLTGVSFSHIYLPIVRSDAERNGNVMDKLCGGKTAIMIIDEENVEGVRNEIIRRLNDMTEGTDYEVDIFEAQPLSHVKNVFIPYAREFSWWEALKKNILVLLILLLVPALNLGGLISGRMDTRVGELGLRKAFGAEKQSIILMVINETLVYTLIGGVFGLILAIVIVMVGKIPLLNMLSPSFGMSNIVETASTTFRPEMFLSFTVFSVALATCIVLNIISAIIPAVLSVRRPIVESLNEKK